MANPVTDPFMISRRKLLWGIAASSAAAALPVLDVWGEERTPQPIRGPAHHTFSLNQNWIFEGVSQGDAAGAPAQTGAQSPITLPHCVVPLSWHQWDPSQWEKVWSYRRSFRIPHQARGLRLFLQFDRVMAGAEPVLNGRPLPKHLGGFLPFEYEITRMVKDENDLALAVDARWLSAPPAGSPKGPGSIDYLLPGGINGSVRLKAVPSIYIRDVFARPMDVLTEKRRLDLICRLDAGDSFPASVVLTAVMRKNGKELGKVSQAVKIEQADQQFTLTLDRLSGIQLWDTENPELYDVEVTLSIGGRALHRYKTRTGFRDARFEKDGFFLNGKRLRLFGLNRHELYPYFGFAASRRTMRHDAEMLRRKFSCNMVRCSHYPQSEAFMDACDELGLMAWEETPGFQFIGDAVWQELVLQNVSEMVVRDRNHPSVIIWGVRLNESPNDPELYQKTRAIARTLDSTRQTSGTMTPASMRTWKEEWHEDVLAFDDYETNAPGVVRIKPPIPDVPYFVTESVGQFNYSAGKGFNARYRRNATTTTQQNQALFHAFAHDKAAGYARCAGLLGWCAFDYPSLINAYEVMKFPGIADFFRIPKLGAAFYESQVDPRVRPIIAPNFYWDFGAQTPEGPGNHVAIFSNCERLELFIDGKPHSVLHPDKSTFPNTAYPPFFADLAMNGAEKPELEIRGFVKDSMVLSRSFSSDATKDRIWFEADDAEMQGDGSDATRLAFGVVDKFGAPRPFAGGKLLIDLDGPGEIVGDNPFDLGAAGGMGAVWIRTVSNSRGTIRLRAKHSALASPAEVTVRVVPGD